MATLARVNTNVILTHNSGEKESFLGSSYVLPDPRDESQVIINSKPILRGGRRLDWTSITNTTAVTRPAWIEEVANNYFY